MNFKHLFVAAGVAATSFALPQMASADDFSATIAAGHPPVFRWVKMMPEAFIPTAQAEFAKLGHKITFSEQYGGAVAGVGEEFEAAEAGLAELALCSSLFDAAKLPLQNVSYYTPFVSDDPRMVNDLLGKMHREDPRMTQSFTDNNTVYIGGAIGIDDYLLMTKFPVKSLADLKGRKIAAPGPAINWLSGTGAVGVAGNLTTYYNELKTGVYDGVIVFASAALPGKLYEVAPHVTRASLGAQFAGAICANKDWYDGLSADLQKALHDSADAAQNWYMDALEAAAANSFKVMAAKGATITVASDEMRKAWAAGMDNAAQTWAKSLDKEGKPGSAILSAYMEGMRAAGAKPVRDWDKE
ncbi:MAG: C4-dicarboxylate TRAP transporter substrate-binding protein [Rhizobiaceae bacterium]